MMILINFDERQSGKTTKLKSLAYQLEIIKSNSTIIVSPYDKYSGYYKIKYGSIDNVQFFNNIKNLIIDERLRDESFDLVNIIYNLINLKNKTKIENVIISTTLYATDYRYVISENYFNKIIRECYMNDIELIINHKYKIYYDDFYVEDKTNKFMRRDFVQNYFNKMTPIGYSKLLLELMQNDIYTKITSEELSEIDFQFHYGYNINKLKNSNIYNQLKLTHII
jgi:hypothetical protein